jgi:hypothetical protein
MNGTRTLLDRITVNLRNDATNHILPVYIDVADTSLSRKWLAALNDLLRNCYHLEKNYQWFGFVQSARTAEYICAQINSSIQAINASDIGYHIDDNFTVANTITAGDIGYDLPGGRLQQERFNQLHRYFEDLQGTTGHMSPYYTRSGDVTRWHIRQLNLLCHEYESLVLSLRKQPYAPEWMRPSQLMCWLGAPRFALDAEDYDLFGVETINRELGAVYVGVNKAVGKHHWEVFSDEGRNSRIGELTTTTLRTQTLAAGDFDIEWANNPGAFPWQQENLQAFRNWLQANGWDPEDKTLTIGHPQVAQVDLHASFGTVDYRSVWAQLGQHLNVDSIKTSQAEAEYKYTWSDSDYMYQQIDALKGL